MIFRFIKLSICTYILIFAGMGTMKYLHVSQSFYEVDRHFSPYLNKPKFVSAPVIEGAWCTIIARDDIANKSSKEMKRYAEDFFRREIEPIAAEQGYDIKRLKDWFIRYAAFQVKSMPLKEFLLDWKGEKTVIFREIDLSAKPERNIAYFFKSPDIVKDAFWALLALAMPLIILYIFFTRDRYAG